MINIYKKNTLNFNQIQVLLMLFILQGVFIIHFNLFNISLFQQGSKPAVMHIVIEEKPAPTAVEEEKTDPFTHQLKKAEPLYNPIILEAANLHDVDLAMVKAIIMAESSFNRKSVSRHGAGGLMQLMPRTAKSLGVKDIFDPHENIHAGVKYYKSLLTRFDGDEKLALAAYNAGATNVRRYKGVPPFKETRKYIKKVMGYQHFYKHGSEQKETTSI